MTQRVVVIGAGIVGICVAHELARRGISVTVLERDDVDPRGSTTYAPGFIGLYNDAPVLTDLARRSASFYTRATTRFSVLGGLELSTSANGAMEVVRRIEAALATGLFAERLAVKDLPPSVTDFVNVGQLTAAAYFPNDGVADTRTLARELREQATSFGSRFEFNQDVVHVERSASLFKIRTLSGEVFTADDIVLATGIWGPTVTSLVNRELPLTPVAHPYVYSDSQPNLRSGPFLRWPEHHVYARVHHNKLGIGSYNHAPAPIQQDELHNGASLPWRTDFDPVITSAQQLLRPAARFTPAQQINGVFAMTPDNLPFLGPHPEMPGAWIAQAIWVTHAAGAAQTLVDAITKDNEIPTELAINRFDGTDPTTLKTRSLTLYRDIYATDLN